MVLDPQRYFGLSNECHNLVVICKDIVLRTWHEIHICTSGVQEMLSFMKVNEKPQI